MKYYFIHEFIWIYIHTKKPQVQTYKRIREWFLFHSISTNTDIDYNTYVPENNIANRKP